MLHAKPHESFDRHNGILGRILPVPDRRVSNQDLPPHLPSPPLAFPQADRRADLCLPFPAVQDLWVGSLHNRHDRIGRAQIDPHLLADRGHCVLLSNSYR